MEKTTKGLMVSSSKRTSWINRGIQLGRSPSWIDRGIQLGHSPSWIDHGIQLGHGCRPAFSLGTSMFGNRTQYNGIGEYGCRLVKFECRSIRTVSHNPTDSASGVSRCSVGGVDRHQCELPMDMELST
ncbi:hypothetical protein F2Q69_00016055 [Brassica cretica]|uniref:Uncharacterized protein n=1 Tax=Brassica cretica TaxID=69181 RepID=A0A8S9QYL2_BRACR|nr:hypothetical protein F2Q69_00016055 [Brassica cretica]